jgi:hypothetical protein
MRQHLSTIIITMGLVLAATASARAEELSIDGAGKSVDEDCAGRDVVINGAGHTINLTGTCARVKVNGTGQIVDLEAVARIAVHGTDNRVTYVRGVKGKKKPKIARSGLRNTVKKRKPST